MKSNYQFIEPLEPRIAPALLVNGGNLLGGKGNPTTGQTSIGGNAVTLVTVIKGEALVFFDSANGGIITGISVGKHTKLDINGDINGDIVTNLLPDGRLTDSDHNPANGQNGGILLPVSFEGLTTHPLGPELGSVGRIIAGGSVSHVNVAGNLSGVYAGDGIFKTTTNGEVDVNTGGVDYNTIMPGLNDIIQLHAHTAQSSPTPSISNLTVGVADHLQVFAGDGKGQVHGAGNAGGSITDVTVTTTMESDLSAPAIYLHAGNGAKGAPGEAGGAGGSITQYTDAASTSFVKVETGNGGAAPGGSGGAGGSFTDSTISSNAIRYDILVGNGGLGATGGAGGSIDTVSFSDAVTGQAPLIATGYFTGGTTPGVLLINTVTGNATLSEGTALGAGMEAPFQVVLHPAASVSGAATTTPFIAPDGSVPSDVVAADLNGDGKLDFVVSYSSSDNLGIFLNQGNGNFTASSVPLPASPSKIAVGDFLNTGRLDIAVLTSGTVATGGSTLSSQIYVAEGDGTGAFLTISPPDSFTGVATDLVAGQLNGAGGDDVAVGFKSGFVDTFLANGSTTAAPFTLAGSLIVFNGPISNLDINGTTLLAFTVNSTANSVAAPTVPPTTPVATPLVQLLNVTSTGALNMGTGFPLGDALPLAAHFLGSVDAIGVVDAGGISVYTPSVASANNSYTESASLASDGALANFVSIPTAVGFQLDAVGAASSRFFSANGNLGDLSGVGSLLPFDIPGEPYVTTIQAGAGGAGIAHNGGAGGSITDLTFTQTLGPGVEQAGARFDLTVATGSGGTSRNGTGGAGGGMQQVALSLNPADTTGEQDSTTLAALSTGAGGNGASGGHGGNLSKITSNSIFDQPASTGTVIVNSVALQLVAGSGGNATHGAGGDGGSISLSAQPALSGVSDYDIVSTTPFAPGLLVESGNGGNGTTTGGNGGDLINIQTQNAAASGASVKDNELGSALITSGSGGQGGAGAGGNGGAITGLNVAVQSQSYAVTDNLTNTGLVLDNGGALKVTSGSGGLSKSGAGGSGGSITQAKAASVDGDGFRDDNDTVPLGETQFPGFGVLDPYAGVGVLLQAGAGANGKTGGGSGGSIEHLQINSPSAPDVYAAILLGGAGGKAIHTGLGGDGGSIENVVQTQDVNSTLSLIQGGNAGMGPGNHGGSGGSVEDVNTAGFIGLPATNTADLGVFNDTATFQVDNGPAEASPLAAALFGTHIPQGIFVGRGAVGGVSGSVINIVAGQIAAIGAAENASGIFAPAHKVDDIAAELIGYQVVRNNVFASTVPGASPAHAQPIDGFILASSVEDIMTDNNGRTAKFTFKG